MKVNRDFKFTIFRTKKDGTGGTIRCIDFNTLINSIKTDTREGLITKFRALIPYVDSVESHEVYKLIPRLCAACEYYRNKSLERVFRAYNGVVCIVIDDLGTSLEVEKAKKQAAMMPQTLLAMTGSDGRSVVVLTLATLPDGSLPKDENSALLFATQAYMTAVQCLQPLTEFHIRIEQQALDNAVLLTVDDKPYVNTHPVPFIIEQPTELSVIKSEEKASAVKALLRMAPGAESNITFIKVFNAAYHRGIADLNWNDSMKAEALIVHVAQLCYDSGLPEEETVIRLHHHFWKMELDDVRALVRNVYCCEEKPKNVLCMNKHQIVAYGLREFIERRYDIRFNTVLQMTEFRERHSFRFLYRELNRRELNTIFHEALIEGISPTFGEVDTLVHSTFIPSYNPIEDYLNNLPQWDGVDRMTPLSKMVPTDNPHWERLFKQWFLSMVAHWMNGDEKHANSTAPILIGAQGYRKSTFCRLLLPPELQQFYTDSIDFRTNIEAERALSRFLIINVDEFDQLTDKQFAFVKHLFQKPTTNIRRMYSETIGTQRRYASFIGTTNVDEVLRDPTGNRRYLCVNVTDIIRTEESIDHKQLYAQAKHLITSGTRYWLNDEDEQLIRITNERFAVQSPLEEHFLTAFSLAQNEEEGDWLRLSEIMETLSNLPTFSKKQDCDYQKLGRVMTKLKVRKQRKSHGFEYLVKRNE